MDNNPSTPTVWTEEGLQNLLVRLEHQSCQPDFQIQRQLALRLALQPYMDSPTGSPLSPLPEEEDLAKWFLYADYLPSDDHNSLIEQVRDLVTEHVPEEERVWLDPLRHSYMDLLEVRDLSPGKSVHARLQSLGDQQTFKVLLPAIPVAYQIGQVLLTRLPRRNAETPLPGPPLVLSPAMGHAVFNLVNDTRREMEIRTGNFDLSVWAEFAKLYGYMMIWAVAQIRRGTWTAADSQISYINTQGEIFLYALALYEHDDFRMLAEGLNKFEHFSPEQNKGGRPKTGAPSGRISTWVWLAPQEQLDRPKSPLARLTLTPTQLYVETDSPNRLDTVKHQLAAIFGFSLHFRGETTSAPHHTTPEVNLLSDTVESCFTTVSNEEEQQILASFLETVYLEWAETPSPFLKGQSPRHYCTTQPHIKQVEFIIDQMEQYDLGRRRLGRPAYDYNILRAHIGL